MEVRPFRQPVGWAISLQCPNEGQGTKNIKIQCPIVTKTRKQNQQTFPMQSAVPPQANLVMASNTASPTLLHVSPATVRTHKTYDQQQHDSLCSSETKVGKVKISNLKHDDGHIHRASPIWGLPLEQSDPTYTKVIRQEDLHKLMMGMQRTQQELIEHKASNRALTWPAESQDKRGTKGRTLGLLHEAPWLPTSSNARK